MVKFPEAAARLFHNKFACKRCKSVTKSNMIKVTEGKASCKKCGSKALRTLRKK
jgi:transcription elongation factor Elf1